MATGDAQRDKRAVAPISWPCKHPHGAYVANICDEEAIRHVVHTHGPGERAVSWPAKRQLGVIAARQLQLAGLGRRAISNRLAKGSLHRIYRGVYLVGHPTPVPGAIALAAVLAAGRGAVISHRSAALLWGFLDHPVEGVDVTIAGRNCRPRAGLRIHRVRHLPAREVRQRGGIPVTAPARTVLDYASQAKVDELARAIAQASAMGLLDETEVKSAMNRAGARPGIAKLRAFLGEDGIAPTRSEAERRMRRLLRAADLPMPEVNIRVGGYLADFAWLQEQLILELDGYLYHSDRAAFERDRRKDMALRNAGYEVMRLTWRVLVDEPFAVVAHVARALERRERT